MAAWRMAFRRGTNGPSMWDECRKRKVAINEYTPFDDVDLSRYPRGEPQARYSQLRGTSQHASLKRFVYDMDEGDIIYVKEGPLIVAKGVVDSDYFFDKKNTIVDDDDVPWQHQRKVIWTPFVPEVRIQIGLQQIYTVYPLNERDVKRIEKAAEAIKRRR